MEEKELGGKNEPATSPRHRKGNLFADDGKKEKGGGRSSVNVSMKRIEFRKILSDARLGLGHMRHRIGEVAESVKNAAGSQASKMLVRTRDGQVSCLFVRLTNDQRKFLFVLIFPPPKTTGVNHFG